MMWLNRSMRMNSVSSTVPGRQTLARSLRARSTSIRCSARSFSSTASSAAKASSASGVAPRGPGSGDGMAEHAAVRHLDERLGRRPDDRDRAAVLPLVGEQVHVGRRVQLPEHAVDVERARRRRQVEALGDDDLEHVAVADVLLRRHDGVEVVLPRGAQLGLGHDVEVDLRQLRLDGRAEPLLERVEPPLGVRPGGHLVLGAVVQDGDDEGHGALEVVDRDHLGHEHHAELGHRVVRRAARRAAARAVAPRPSRCSPRGRR